MTNIDDNINMDSTIADSLDARNLLTTNPWNISNQN